MPLGYVSTYLTMVIAIDDDFDQKEELYNIILNIDMKKEPVIAESGIPLMMLALRFMIEARNHFNDGPFGFSKPDEKHFFQMYLMYLNNYKYDDLPHWNEDDLEFYNRRSFQISKDSSREDIYKKLKELFDSAPALSPKLRNLLDGGFKEFNHWYSVV
jgi:hypothetical protein